MLAMRGCDRCQKSGVRVSAMVGGNILIIIIMLPIKP
jgi:hypothetical protein